jgi:DNA mismatch repair protein MutL
VRGPPEPDGGRERDRDGGGTQGEIVELDTETVQQIAAGEVVERPASAVKELVENALDAGASRVAVAVEGDGTETIRVRDDGVGMTADELELAVEEHTTSKIRGADDLDGGVATLGFRGEALSTIGAVSRLAVTTRAQGADRGARIRVEGGDAGAVEPAGRAPGTTVEVADLFYNTPARREYLRTEATEFARINRVVTRYALANPDVAVSLEHDGRETFATDGRGDLRGTVMAVYGREVAEAMTPVEHEAGEVRVHGLVADPETTRSTREYLSTFVNGRYVSEPALREAVLDGYGSALAADRYPFTVLFVDLPPGDVDANVHPRKMEVRFADEAAVTGAVGTAVDDALGATGPRSGAARGRSKPEEATVDPAAGDTPTGTESGGSADTDTDAGETTADTDSERTHTRQGRKRDGTASAEGGSGGPRTPTDTETANATTPDDGAEETEDATAGEHTDRNSDSESVAAPASGRLGEAPDTSFDRLPDLRVLGQLHETYLVAESPEGLVLVDQHAADERVHYERLADRLADSPGSQRLVSPATLELTAAEAAAFEDALPALDELGFEATLAGRTARVTAVPAVLSEGLDPEVLRDVLAEFLDGRGDAGAARRAADALVADMACAPAVTGHTPLTDGSALALLEALDGCENPYACPHGRPTVVELDEAEIGERFERDYPGHAARRPE